MRIDLIYFSDSIEVPPVWEYGESRALPPHIPNAMVVIDTAIKNSTGEFSLLWDFRLGSPDIKLIQQLVKQPVDVWHAGLKLGLQAQPELLHYIYPTWLYSIDADPAIASTSFRLSFRACLFRNRIWLTAGKGDGTYSSFEMAGLDLGYRWLKAGALIRYNPQLVNIVYSTAPGITLQDQFKFIRRNFPKKWVYWAFYRSMNKNFSSSLRSFWNTRFVKQLSNLSLLNPKQQTGPPTAAKISILIPTLDRYPYLINELEQLRKQTFRGFEILITDQTDKDRRKSEFLDHFRDLDIRYFPQEEKGQCIAWNKLLEEATGEYVLFLGDDADEILPDFLSKLISCLQHYQVDMVAAHVEEVGISYPDQEYDTIKIAEGFPICLVKKDLLVKTGYMDMVFNRDIRADHDLAMRCHLKGAFMIHDHSCRILHHRAPSGGLRAHKARVNTRHKSKNSIATLVLPTVSEIYLINKYYPEKQVKEELRIRMLSLFFVNGNKFKKLLRFFLVIIMYPKFLMDFAQKQKKAKKFLMNVK